MRNDSDRCVDKNTEKISRRNIGRTASDAGMDNRTGTPLMRAYVKAALTGLAGLVGMLILTHA